MVDTSTPATATTPERPRLPTAWPILAACASVAAGTSFGIGLGAIQVPPAGTILFPLLALMISLSAVLLLARIPSAAIAAPFIAIAAATATLLGLLPFDQPNGQLPVELWLIVTPWRYALPPLMVHFVLLVAWPHRIARWYGLVLGLYVLHASLWAATLCGIMLRDDQLLQALDLSLRRYGLEPMELFLAAVAGTWGLVSINRASIRRRSIWLTLAAIVLALGPSILVRFVPDFGFPLFADYGWDRFAIGLFPIIGLAAALALPRVDLRARDLLGHELASTLLQDSDLTTALRRMAVKLEQELEADGVRIRLLQPQVDVSEGEVATLAAEENIPADAETLDNRRVLIAPIGRGGDPLGEVRVHADRIGAFGRREREWLSALLIPVAIAARARHREAGGSMHITQAARQAADAARLLGKALAAMPQPPREDGMGVPPSVDATAVLSQLRDGIDATAQHGEIAAAHSLDVRSRARLASDEIARALDSLQLLSAEVERLSRAGEEIAASNETVSTIAFRTNLLANNASLEATRSGGAGRTFGVLAEEIRRLADSASATSAAIGERTGALAREVGEMEVALRTIREALGAAIRGAEGVEDATRILNDEVGLIGGTARAMHPSIEEAYTVAGRRSARDAHQSSMLAHFLDEREQLATDLNHHRELLEQLGLAIEKLAKGPRGNPLT